MNLIHFPSDLHPPNRKVCLAIGMFDGVHLGHQQVIRQTVADASQHEATPVVVTFDRHPALVVRPDRAPSLIYSRSQKLRAIRELGAGVLLEIPFDHEFSQKTGQEFIGWLLNGFGRIHSVCVGAAFTFGHQRSGNIELLKQLGVRWNFAVHGLAAVSLDDQVVSSTRIRSGIRAGELDAVGQMLGRPYSLAARVVHGDRLGHQLGFPTANLDVAGMTVPPTGVYSAHARIDDRENRRAVINVGYRPTVDSSQTELRVEAHLLDFEKNIYGEEVEVQFVQRIREERKFASVEELKGQIEADIRLAQKTF